MDAQSIAKQSYTRATLTEPQVISLVHSSGRGLGGGRVGEGRPGVGVWGGGCEVGEGEGGNNKNNENF